MAWGLLARRLLEQWLVGTGGGRRRDRRRAIATYPYWGGGYGYGGGCWQVRPTYDAYGNYLGDQSVNVC